MFDIGFSELILIGIVALLVIGPERLPETIRTASTWLNRIRRGFNEIKQEVQHELHNDAVMRDLRQTGEQLKKEAGAIGRDLPEGFQTREFVLEHGFLDKIVDRRELKPTLSRLFTMFKG